MQTSGSNNQIVRSQSTRSQGAGPQTHNLRTRPARSTGKKSASIKSEVDKSLEAIALARKNAGENHPGSGAKTLRYTAVILSELKRIDPAIGSKFMNNFGRNLSITKQANNEAIKPAAHQALNDLVRSGDLTLDQVKKITHIAWKVVYKDPAEKRVATSRLSITTNSGSGALNPESTPAAGSVNAQQIDAPAGFLWKPIADSPPHNLAILLPPQWTDNILVKEGVEILDPDNGEVLGRGKYGGNGNGGREHFRFDQQGASFPDGAIVRVHFKDGSVKDIQIGDSSSRIEGR